MRKGRVVGRKGFILDKVEDLTPGGLVDRILEEMYGDEPPSACPSRCSCRSRPTTSHTYEEWLTHLRGSRVQIRVPQRGDKRALHETVTRNAKEEFIRHRLRRAGDHNARSRALTELQDLLGLPEAPLRIECYDMAHLQGTDYVGSMVVLEDGLPNKREYRRFKVKDVPGNDDYAAMEEVLTRRLHGLPRRARPAGHTSAATRPGKFAYPPQLLLVDGGKGQLGVAERVVDALGLADEIPIAGLAKRFEEVYVPGRSEPVEVPRGSEALFMLQRIRDEAHRFANTFHRELRGKRMTTSSLDGIPGLGEARKKKLVQAMGGVNAVKRAVARRPEGAVVPARRGRRGDPRQVPPAIRVDAVPRTARLVGADRARTDGVRARRERPGGGRRLSARRRLGRACRRGEVGDDELVEAQLDVLAEHVDELARPIRRSTRPGRPPRTLGGSSASSVRNDHRLRRRVHGRRVAADRARRRRERSPCARPASVGVAPRVPLVGVTWR